MAIIRMLASALSRMTVAYRNFRIQAIQFFLGDIQQTKIHLFFSLSHTHTFPIANNSYHSFFGRHAFSSSQPHANSRVSTSRSFCTTSFDRDSIEYDVVIVDTGPAGLSATIQLKQMCCQRNLDLFVCVLEKRHDQATLSCFGRGI
ncbi:Electron transfer flavoprotein-ubiquinone oxidoreductase, mitochondrial [Glycine soja]